MEFLRNNTPPVDGRTTVVTGRTLSETYKLVRQEFGPDAVISGSRTNTRRKRSGWGTEQVVEVLVENPAATLTRNDKNPSTADSVTDEIRFEVERLEKMVEDLCASGGPNSSVDGPNMVNPLGELLVRNGASHETVARLLTRFSGESGLPMDDRPAAIGWLTEYLGTGETTLSEFSGLHAFLGEHAGDRLDLVLHLARTMTNLGRKVLVVSIVPDPERDLPRLRTMAAAAGHDAAVVHDPDQLEEIQEHVTGYDVALLDLPVLTDPALGEGSPIHKWLGSNLQVNRHLQIPMDRDFMDLADLREAARLWNCDSLALVRLDGTRRPAKLLDLIETIPLPVSILAENATGDGYLEAASPELLIDRVLASQEGPRFKRGLEIEGA